MASKRSTKLLGSPSGPIRDRGDTLIEVLVAVTIIGICVVPLLNSLIESFTGSTQHRSVATIDTLLKSFAETAKSEIELEPSGGTGTTYTACNPSSPPAYPPYQLLSAPSPSTATDGPQGTAVTIFGTGFHPNVPVGTFSVKVGPTATPTTATVLTAQSSSSSDSNGNVQLTFQVPSSLPASELGTSQPITVSDNQSSATTETTASGIGLTVTSTSAGATTSADAGYTLGIRSVQYLDSDTGSFETCSSNTDTAATTSGIEMVTLLATAPTGNSDTLSFLLRNPTYSATSVPTPAVVVTPSTAASLSLPTGASTIPITFTATVEPPSTNPPATGTITWSTNFGGCSSTSQSAGSGNTEVATCTTTVSSSSSFGAYTATATYPADAYDQQSAGSGTVTVYASDGSGTISVNPGTVWAGSSGNTLTFTYTAPTGGVNGGEVDIPVPSGWTAPQATSATSAGYTTSSSGTVQTSGQTISITGLTLAANSTVTVTYGAGGGAAGATAPTATGSYTFQTSEKSTLGGTSTPLASSPTVTVTSARLVSTGTATSGKTATASNSVTAGLNVTYVIYAYTSNSGTGDTASPSASGFTIAPTFTPIGLGQAFDANKDHAWAWYTTGGTGTGTFKVTFGNSITQAFIDVIQLNGNSVVAPIVVTTEGFTVSGGLSSSAATSSSATANLGGTPTSTDPEIIFLASEGDFGTSPPTLSAPSGFVNLVSTDTGNGSRAIYTGLVHQNETLTLSSSQHWGTIALEING